MKKILLITLEYPPVHGGVASYYAGLVEELKRQGHEVIVISKGLLARWFWPRWLIGYFTVRKAINTQKQDVLFVGHLLPLGTIAYLLRRRVPYIVFAHGMDVLMAQKSWRKRWLAKKILGQAQLVVANSEFTKNEIEKIENRKWKIEVLYPCPNVVAEAKAEEVEELRRRLGLAGKRVLLTLGRVVERKGHDLVIRALPEILQHVPETVYVVAGEGPDLGRLQRIVATPHPNPLPQGEREKMRNPSPATGRGQGEGLQTAVRFVGEVSDEERPAYYALCDLFVMPSRQIGPIRAHGRLWRPTSNGIKPDVEGFGLSFLEAAMFGKPSVGGRSGGVPEAILDGKTGALVDPLDVSGLARVVVQLLHDDRLRHELGQNAKARAVHEFRWERQIEKLKM